MYLYILSYAQLCITSVHNCSIRRPCGQASKIQRLAHSLSTARSTAKKACSSRKKQLFHTIHSTYYYYCY